MANFKQQRQQIGISQSRLARLSGVSRFNICCSELGQRLLTDDERTRIRSALKMEITRMRAVMSELRV